jgi:hypothetical protein
MGHFALGSVQGNKERICLSPEKIYLVLDWR